MINRIDDRAAIEKLYAESIGKPTLLLLYARTGVGKSYFIEKVFMEDSNSCYIKCQINQREAAESKGIYISCLAKALNSYAQETTKFPTIKGYIQTIYKVDNENGSIVNDLLDIAAEISRTKTIKEKLDKPRKFKDELLAKILESDNDTSISFLREYIIYLSKGKNIVINIENIQEADVSFINF